MKISQMRHWMKQNRTDRLLKWMALLAAILMLSACASAGKKFLGTTEANVGIFADTTIAMIGDPELGFTHNTAIHTREFFNYDEKEERKMSDAMRRAEVVLGVMVRYSLKLVTIAESEPEAEVRVRLYADYLGNFNNQVLKALGLERGYYDRIIQNVRQQKKFMDALRAAQPIINGAGRYMQLALRDLSEVVDILDKKIEEKIQIEFADVIRYQEVLESEKYEILATLEQLYLFTKGDKAAYKRALAKGTILSKKVIPIGSSPSYEEVRKMGKFLEGRLDSIDRIWKEIETDWTNYNEAMRELDRLAAEGKKQIATVRLTSLVWTRAHMKMASGIYSPAEWFNIKDAPAALIGLGVKTVL